MLFDSVGEESLLFKVVALHTGHTQKTCAVFKDLKDAEAFLQWKQIHPDLDTTYQIYEGHTALNAGSMRTAHKAPPQLTLALRPHGIPRKATEVDPSEEPFSEDGTGGDAGGKTTT